MSPVRKNYFAYNKTIILEKISESFSSVFPITMIILFLAFTFTPIPSGLFLCFLGGSFLLVVGMGLFTLGADIAMRPIGEYVGSTLMNTKKLAIIIPISLIIGVLITLSEPDLSVFASEISSIPNFLIMLIVGVGVGIFLVIAILRVVFKIKLKYLLLGFYGVVFILSIFVPKSFLAIAFDSGGVTTGPMSVPFILALGTGITSLRVNQDEGEVFGLTALCSIGPIIAVMILGLIMKIENIEVEQTVLAQVNTSQDFLFSFTRKAPKYLLDVLIALVPIIVIFVIFCFFGHKMSKEKIIQIIIGIVYTYVGLVIFLIGVNAGFLPAGVVIGEEIGKLSYSFIIIPIGFIVGYFVVAAEPAVHILTKQVEDLTSGNLSRKVIRHALMIGVGIAIALSMARVYFGFNILWILIPGYIISIVLCFFVPDMFTGIAFDSGGVASGAMTTSFVLPLTIGFSTTIYGNNDSLMSFGVIALVAMTPLIAIQTLGLIYKIKQDRLRKAVLAKIAEQVQTQEEEII